MDLRGLSADDILTMPQYRAADLFGDNPDKSFKILARRWHPDICHEPRAGEVFARVMALREVVERGIGEIVIVGTGGEERLHLEPWADTDTGRRWIGPGLYAWSFEREPDLADVFVRHLRSVPFADDEMRKQMRKVFPRLMRRVTHEDAPMIIFPRRDHAVLADWIKVHGPMPPEHAAWLCSGLLNVASYATWSHWSFPFISMDTVAINPVTHKVALVGGWEGAAPAGKRPVVATKRTLSLCPGLTAPTYRPPATLTTDVVRQTIREVLGDPTGSHLRDRGVPEAIVDWLRAPSKENGVEEYKNWYRVMQKAFGKRRFVKWDRTVVPVYLNPDA